MYINHVVLATQVLVNKKSNHEISRLSIFNNLKGYKYAHDMQLGPMN